MTTSSLPNLPFRLKGEEARLRAVSTSIMGEFGLPVKPEAARRAGAAIRHFVGERTEGARLPSIRFLERTVTML